jgi:hypothetical protein
LRTSFCGSSRRKKRSFAQGNSARAIQRCLPTATAASDGRTVASPASGVSVGGWLSGSHFAACLQRRRVGFGRIVRLAAFVIFFERGRVRAPRARRKREQVCSCGIAGAIERENRMLESVSVRRKSAAEVVGQQSDPESYVLAFRVNSARRRWVGTGI